MHELSIAQALLEQTEAQAAGRAVRGIRLRVGLFAGVSPEALTFAFETLKADFPCAVDAALAIERLPALFVCNACGRQERLARPRFRCVACGGATRLGEKSRELELAELRFAP